ncbi:hypothetical protein HBI81_057360 [Parastagonospora nodorum]|nr:hypothetical protein HBH75_044920 [Parastagonospora nodorum]KAH6168035.1 hypothetical protein HBI68_094650 [Parastagonospora nodorum]KAH6233159.1 hypothetical protein HBI43_023390 [Parastagonospora nodorum]KAH6275210.1 hypothetical protein HBI42_006510 [Parastagonospora nodorum]KAH6436933.1 hypothetical protein HBI14_013310 [Parastagonospora nodorum]
MASQQTGSTQNTQYDKIGRKYNNIKVLPATEPEEPSIIKALGDIKGARCLDLACGTGKSTSLLYRLGASSVVAYDISTPMITSARSLHPSPSLTFDTRDCSIPSLMQHPTPFDIVFAGWFLNYAGTETELTNMFRVIEQNLTPGGRFVGVTTNAHDACMTQPKTGFYGLDVLVLEERYVAPDSGVEVGIKARVVVGGEGGFGFDVFQFRAEVYERCAREAGLRLKWGEVVLPDDERVGEGYWEEFLLRPTFDVVEAVRI